MLNDCCVQSHILGSGNTAANKTDKSPAVKKLTVEWRKETRKKKKQGSTSQFVDEKCYKEIESRAREIESK